ncbi:leucyl aminopeptidase family protein [Acetobacteraceae bacterium H6797]|nr:leucyl aminopeptidase family protein [Acetobacteraceae bacterium H6797]
MTDAVIADVGSAGGLAGSALPLIGVRGDGLEAALSALPAAQAAFVRAQGFKAAAGALQLLPGDTGLAGALLGLGEAGDSPWTYGGLPYVLPEGSLWRLEGAAEAAPAALGWALGAYRFTRYRKASRMPARLVAPGTEASLQMAEAICHGRDLINTPASDMGPGELAGAAAALAEACGASCEIIEGQPLDAGFPCLATVGRGATAERAPRVAVLRWTAPGGEKAPLIALCGKGVCFDTGGLDLKPPSGMLRMKKDMGGAATVLALAESLMRAKVPCRLLVLIGAVENAVSAASFRPGDILPTRSGKTVEIGNTDAEGRLVLADLLTYACEHEPALIIDCATLTGAARVALGPDLPALFSNDDAFAAAFLAAGKSVHDAAWQLPLHAGYDSWLDSSVADFNNVSSKPMAGSVVAALFLERFITKTTKWVHLDLYAWNDSTRPGRPEGGEIQAMRGLHAGIVTLLSSVFGNGSVSTGA